MKKLRMLNKLTLLFKIENEHAIIKTKITRINGI